MKFSIIVPCYKIETRVNELFEMLCSQDYKDYEAIFIDDCSPDKSYEKMKEYCKSYENYIITQTDKNGGPSYARNYGLTLAKGDFVIFCDSDDYFDINVLNELSTFIQNHIDADFILSPFYKQTKNRSKIIDEYKEYSNNDMLKPVNLAGDNGNLFSKVFKMQIIKQNNIKMPNRMLGEDKCFCVNYALHSSVGYKFSKTYYTYKINSTSVMHNKNNYFINEKTTYEEQKDIIHKNFPEIEIKMFVENHMLAKVKAMYYSKTKNKDMKKWIHKNNEQYVGWINNINIESQSIYRKLICKAIYNENIFLIKFILWIRKILY